MGMNPKESEAPLTKRQDESGNGQRQLSDGKLNLVVFIGLALLCFAIGDYSANIALRDPDTCWLLALGRCIFREGALPASDPFSYTFAEQNQPFVVYQWLAALAYYAVYKGGRLIGLITANGCLIGASALGVPTLMFWRMKTPLKTAAIILIVALLSVRTRFFVRAEVPSYALFFVWLYLLNSWKVWSQSNQQSFTSKRNLAFTLSLSLVMLLWANCHITFVYGFLALGLLLISEIIGLVLKRKPILPAVAPLLVAGAVTLLTSLINPKGPGLLAYVPTLIFSGSNRFVGEVQPTEWLDFAEPVYQKYMVPFGVLLSGAIALFVFNLFKSWRRNSGHKWIECLDWYSLMVLGFVIYSTASSRRAVAFGAIFLLYQCAYMLRRCHQDSEAALTAPVSEPYLSRGKVALILCATSLVTGLGAYLKAVQVPPSLPQNSQAFKVPVDALELLAKYPQPGRLFNDAQYGDLLIWYLPKKMPVFIDTRFGMYGSKLSAEYFDITNCEPGFDKLIDQYAFDWAFVPATTALAQYFRDHHDWTELYRDDTAAIFRRGLKNLDKSQ
jgi:hypothetical protein